MMFMEIVLVTFPPALLAIRRARHPRRPRIQMRNVRAGTILGEPAEKGNPSPQAYRPSWIIPCPSRLGATKDLVETVDEPVMVLVDLLG
jgi:hypothetical protein